LRHSNWKSPREFRAISATVNCAYTRGGTPCAAIRDSKQLSPRLLRKIHDLRRILVASKSDTGLWCLRRHLWPHITPGRLRRLWVVLGHFEQSIQQLSFVCRQIVIFRESCSYVVYLFLCQLNIDWVTCDWHSCFFR
jgi:hypothetical protein